MLEEAIQGLKIDPEGVYVDVTFGVEAIYRNILQSFLNKGKLLLSIRMRPPIKIPFQTIGLPIDGNFSHLKRHLKFCGITTEWYLCRLWRLLSSI